jgi:hypothetical protein
MKYWRAAIWVIPAFMVGIGWALFWSRVSMPQPRMKDWLRISCPVFANRTLGGSQGEIVRFSVTNVGPRSLQFGVSWYECRVRTDLTLLATSVRTNAGGYIYGFFGEGKLVRLAPRATVEIRRDLAPSTSSNADRVFCCEIGWREDESLGMRVRNLVQEYISRCLTVFNIYWKPAAPWGIPAQGSAFASNVKVPDFFRLVYGVKSRNGPFPRRPGSFYEDAAETAFGMSTRWCSEWAEQSEPAERGSR